MFYSLKQPGVIGLLGCFLTY